MNDPQNLGLGELGQRVQAMSDPAPDSRLRPYHGTPPSAPVSNGHAGPSLESYEDLRNAAPQSTYQPPQAAYGHQPFQPTGPAPTTNSSSAPGHDPLAAWETVPLRSYAASPSTPPSQQQASLPS